MQIQDVTLADEKRLRIERNAELKSSMASAEKNAIKVARQVRSASKQFLSNPAEALAVTDSIISAKRRLIRTS